MGLAPISLCPATVASYFTEKINNFNKHQWARAWCSVGSSAGLVYVWACTVHTWLDVCIFCSRVRGPAHVCLSSYLVPYSMWTITVEAYTVNAELMNNNRDRGFLGMCVTDCCALERPWCPFLRRGGTERRMDEGRNGWMDGRMWPLLRHCRQPRWIGSRPAWSHARIYDLQRKDDTHTHTHSLTHKPQNADSYRKTYAFCKRGYTDICIWISAQARTQPLYRTRNANRGKLQWRTLNLCNALHIQASSRRLRQSCLQGAGLLIGCSLGFSVWL